MHSLLAGCPCSNCSRGFMGWMATDFCLYKVRSWMICIFKVMFVCSWRLWCLHDIISFQYGFIAVCVVSEVGVDTFLCFFNITYIVLTWDWGSLTLKGSKLLLGSQCDSLHAFLTDDTKFITMVNSMLIYHRFQQIILYLWLVRSTCAMWWLVVPCANTFSE